MPEYLGQRLALVVMFWLLLLYIVVEIDIYIPIAKTVARVKLSKSAWKVAFSLRFLFSTVGEYEYYSHKQASEYSPNNY